MPFCIGKKACDRARCKQRCDSWFAGLDDVVKMCKNACGYAANEIQTRDDFLCSGKYITDDRMIAQYKLDGCTTNDYGFDDYAGEGKPDVWNNTLPLIVVLVLAAAALIWFIINKKL